MNTKSNKSVIVRFEDHHIQDQYVLNRVYGSMKGSSMIDLIDEFLGSAYSNEDFELLEANPRDPKRSSVTSDIIESLKDDPKSFHFRSKGILISASNCTPLERNRFELQFEDSEINGILDGGHNTFAIALHMLSEAGVKDSKLKSIKRWRDLPEVWEQNRDAVRDVRDKIEFLVPTEVIYPKDTARTEFVSSILQIAQARNNNTQLTEETKANKAGYYEILKESVNAELKDRIEWRSNDGGRIKSREIVALSLIPLSVLDIGKEVNPVIIYSSKSQCVRLYERILSTEGVIDSSPDEFGVKLKDPKVKSALQLISDLPGAYDYIYENLPEAYNEAGGKFGRITQVKYDAGKPVGKTKFYDRSVSYSYPDGFIMPLVCALSELIEKNEDGTVQWKEEPLQFLKKHLKPLAASYSSIIQLANFDPQKVGKNRASYEVAKQLIRPLVK